MIATPLHFTAHLLHIPHPKNLKFLRKFPFSTNVGYQSVDLTANQQELKGVMFVNTSGNTIDLQDIKMSAGVSPTGGTFLQWYDPSTAKYTKVYWVKLCDENDDFILDSNNNPVLGWGDSDWYQMNHTFKAGEGFWIKPNNTAESPTISIAGALATSDTSTSFVSKVLTANQQELVANTMPNAGTDLQDIEMSDGVPPTGGTFLQWYDPSTARYTKVYWVKLCDENDDFILDSNNNPVLGWGDNDWYEQSKTLSAGEGFWVKPNNTATNPEIMFPNSLKKSN